ncbi:MAG: hypothetical protein PUP91_32510 [Rhizonema sp. PD37]|nr:hypothetical protein [Rhizonema sp. PD37]
MNYIKRFPFSLSLSVAFSTIMLCQASLPVQAQRGNQSDVTGAIVTTSDIKGPFFSPTSQGRGSLVEFNNFGLRRVVSEASVKVIDELNLNTLPSGSSRPIPSETQQSLLRFLTASRSTEVTPTNQQITRALTGVQGGPTIQQAEQLTNNLRGLLGNFRLTTIRQQGEVRYRRVNTTRLLAALNAYNNIIDRSSAQYLSNAPPELLAIRSILSQITESIRTAKNKF